MAEIATNLVDKVPPSDWSRHDERHRWFLELCALSNVSYRINDKGELQSERSNTPLRNRALFVLNMCARATGTEQSPRDEEGWGEFLEATRIRNRITHPKNQQDLEVSEREYDVVVRGLQWFVRCHCVITERLAGEFTERRRAGRRPVNDDVVVAPRPNRCASNSKRKQYLT